MSDIESLKRVMLATREKAKAMKKSRMESRLKPNPDPMDPGEAAESPVMETPEAEAVEMEQPEMSADEALAEIKDLIARAGA